VELISLLPWLSAVWTQTCSTCINTLEY